MVVEWPQMKRRREGNEVTRNVTTGFGFRSPNVHEMGQPVTQT